MTFSGVVHLGSFGTEFITGLDFTNFYVGFQDQVQPTYYNYFIFETEAHSVLRLALNSWPSCCNLLSAELLCLVLLCL